MSDKEDGPSGGWRKFTNESTVGGTIRTTFSVGGRDRRK